MQQHSINSSITAFLAVSLAIVLVPDFAHATFFADAKGVIDDTWAFTKSVIYIGGAIGIAVCAVFAFLGRFKWSQFFSIAGGLFIVGAAATLIDYLGGGGSSAGL